MQSDLPELRRRVSAAVFGNRAAAEVIGAIEQLTEAGEPSVTTRMVANTAGLGDSVVRPVMIRLEAAGVVQAQARPNGPRSPLHYQVQRGELWIALTALVKTLPH
ncbi:hypothetical protein [Plantactinospora sp. KLBMP9567]|uniref:hypothetical protein n=1 Tax=Plantactinospora sp. KLBMP9567 TaxID=3085900 RepID=UPI00298234DE|nr:hypothetical protein [Plantactinospora sp. KLBMP9567]MDW5327195.1 hypothetical protein [Plantactinospora sp. KLBMP9567]